MSWMNKVSAVAGVALLATSTGCVQMPTERQSVVDQRPQISFRVSGEPPRVIGARVLVDELDMGAVGDFIDGKASLRVLPGTHVIRIQSGGEVLLVEQAYLGDGVSRPFNVK